MLLSRPKQISGVRRYMGIDPGKATGYSIVTVKDGEVVGDKSHDAEWDFFIQVLHGEELAVTKQPELKLQAIVMEDFLLFKHKAQAQVGSRFETCQVIGAVKYMTEFTGIPLYMQTTEHRDTGRDWTGRVPPSDHAKSHRVDAYNHVMYHLISHALIPHPVFNEPPEPNYGGIFG